MGMKETFKAIGDPVRREILELLKGGMMSAGDIASHFDMTQATVSRDIRELQLVKTATADGRYRYVPASASGKVTHSPSRFEMIFRESVLKVDYAGHMVLVKCFSGMANAACEVFDAKQWDNVVGTLSGDDTFFIWGPGGGPAAPTGKQLQQSPRRG